MRKKAAGNIALKVLCVMLTVFCIFSLLLIALTQYTEKICTMQTEGIITDFSVHIKSDGAVDNEYISSDSQTTYYIYTVDYEVDGKKFSNKENESTIAYDKGDTVTVCYDPTKPSRHYVAEIHDSSKSQFNRLSFVVRIFLPFVCFYLVTRLARRRGKIKDKTESE